MKERYRDFLFILICFTLIFNNIPRPIQMNFIGGTVGNKLVFYPLMIGMLYTAWCNWKYKDMLVHKRELGMFVCVYIVTSLISLVVGLYTYPYWPLVMNGPVEQIEKLPKMIGLLGTVNSFAQIFSCSIDIAAQVSLSASARHRNGNNSAGTTFAY